MLPFVRTIRTKWLRLAFILLCAPVSIWYCALSAKPIIPYVELAITEKCSLRCIHCANLMPCYDHPEHLPLDAVTRDIRRLLKGTRAIWVLQLLGGEPLLHPGLKALLEELTQEKKIGRIQVVTNGTLLPTDDVLSQMKHKKVSVLISDYGPYSRKKDALIARLQAAKVRYKLLDYSDWSDFGDLEKRNLSRETLARSFHACASAQCKTLLGGHLYACPRSAHMVRLGRLADENALDLTEEKDFAKRVLAFYNLPTIKACDHCNPPWARRPVPPGEQVSTKDKEK